MAGETRHHHYVPQFYLAGFTASGDRNGRLWVLDNKQRRQWPSSPKNAAHQRDMYSVELGSSLDPMGIEKAFGTIEGQCAEVIRRVKDSSVLPEGEDFNTLLNFVALSWARVPSVRDTISKASNKLIKNIGRMAFAGQSGAEQLKRTLEAEGESIKDLDIAALQKFISSNDYECNLDQNWHMQLLLEMIDALIPILAMRNWSLWLVEPNAPDLICSDRPVALTPSKPLPGGLPPAFGMPNTVLTFPITKRMALCSAFEEIPATNAMDAEDVGMVNAVTAFNAKQIYSSEKDWVWVNNEGIIQHADDFLKMLLEQE